MTSSEISQELVNEVYRSLYEDSSGTDSSNIVLTRSFIDRYIRVSKALDLCGRGIQFNCPNSECRDNGVSPVILREYCMTRICNHPGCIRKREDRIKGKYEAKLNNFDDPRFLTLTLKGYHPLSRDPLDKLNYAWKRMSRLLRKNGYMKSYIKVIELVQHEYVDSSLVYHDVYFWHMHVVYDGIYIPASVLRAAWLGFTSDSNWVNVSRVKRNFSASAYLRKYLQKMAYDDIDLVEYIKVFKMKLISSYGCKEELLTLLEQYIEINRHAIECPFCGSYMFPDAKPELYIPPPSENLKPFL